MGNEIAGAAVDWLIRVVARHGVRNADGNWRIPVSKADLAAEEPCGQGTISWRLEQLNRDGLLVSRSPLIAVADIAVDAAHRVPGPQLAAGAVDAWERHTIMAARAALGAGRVDAAARLLDVVLAADTPAEPLAVAPRIAAEARDQSADAAEAQLASSSSTSTASSLRETPRRQPRAAAAPPRVQRTPEEARALVGELEEMARRFKLPGLTDAVRLRDALGGYEDDQVLAAVAQVALKTQKKLIDSPIGYLVKIAEEHSPVFDNAPPRPPTPPVDEPHDVAVGETCSPEAANEHLATVRGRLR